MIRSFHSVRVRPSIWVDRGGGRVALLKLRNQDDEGKNEGRKEGKEGNGSGGGRTLDSKKPLLSWLRGAAVDPVHSPLFRDDGAFWRLV